MNKTHRISVSAENLPLHNGPTQEEASEGFFSPVLVELAHAIRRRWPLLLAIVTGAMALSLAITLLLPEQYTATSQLEITREQKQITNVQGLDSADAGQDLEFYATQYRLLTTRPVVERVARKLRLAQNEAFFYAHGIESALDEDEPLDFPGRTRAEKIERLIIETLLENISISPVRTSRLVDISYTSRDPSLSYTIANAWADSFIETSMDRQFSSTADARRFLEERIAALRERLEDSERQVVTYATQTGIVSLGKQQGSASDGTLATNNLDALNDALNSAISARISAESRVGGGGADTPEAVTSVALANLRVQRTEAAAEYSRIMTVFEPSYPAAVQLAEKIREIDAAIDREAQRIAQSRRGEYREALQRENALREQVEQLKDRLEKQERDNIQLTIFQREADTNRQLYDALLQRYKEIGVAGIVGASNIAITEKAQVPDEPSGPNLLLNMVLGLLFGAMIASAIAFVLEHIDEGIREPEDVWPLLGLPLLGQTPAVDRDIIEDFGDIKSASFEAYFSLGSNLNFVTETGFPKVLTVTSTRSGEGKSSTSFALASVIGRTGKSVVLVDADMRSPSIHEFFGSTNERGLSNVLAGVLPADEVVRPAKQDGVHFMPAGPKPPSAAELLGGMRLPQMIKALAKKYDHVIIDSPPVLGLTDAPLLATNSDGCIFIVKAGELPARAIRNAIKRLQMTSAEIYGVVLTQISSSPSHSYGYGDLYGYGDERSARDTLARA